MSTLRDYFPAASAHRNAPQQPAHSVSGPNLLPVSPRRSHSSLPTIGSSTRDGMASALNFPVPKYLRHASLYEGRFETVPRLLVDEGVPAFDEVGAVSNGKGKGRASLSLALGVGDSMTSTSASASGRSSGTDNSSLLPPILLPTCWDPDDRCSLLELTSDRMGVSFAGESFFQLVFPSTEADFRSLPQAPQSTAIATQQLSEQTDRSLRKRRSTITRSRYSTRA